MTTSQGQWLAKQGWLAVGGPGTSAWRFLCRQPMFTRTHSSVGQEKDQHQYHAVIIVQGCCPRQGSNGVCITLLG